MKKILFAALFVLSFFAQAQAQDPCNVTVQDVTSFVTTPKGVKQYFSPLNTFAFIPDPSTTGSEWVHTWTYRYSGASNCSGLAGTLETTGNGLCAVDVCRDCDYTSLTIIHKMCNVVTNECFECEVTLQVRAAANTPKTPQLAEVKNDLITYNNNSNLPVSVIILDINGREVQKNDIAANNRADFQMANEQMGIYVLQVFQEGKLLETTKFFK